MNENIELRSVTKEDLTSIEQLLQDNHLPDRDIYENSILLFIASIASKDIGVGGLELYENICLLRSLVIRDAFRGKGYGKELTNKLIDRAKDKGVKEVYLLTTTAADFFRKIEFKKIDRDRVPLAIKNTSQFSSLCPASAICLRKVISK
jgi:amino-acid N-acetyltransferase